jgi:hypothetical protein
MTASVRSSSSKMPPDTSKAIPTGKRTAAARIAALLSSAPAEKRTPVAVMDAEGERVEVPAALSAIIYRAAELIAEGHLVAVKSNDQVPSTQDFAQGLAILSFDDFLVIWELFLSA